MPHSIAPNAIRYRWQDARIARTRVLDTNVPNVVFWVRDPFFTLMEISAVRVFLWEMLV